MNSDRTSAPPAGEILLYQTEDGRTRLQVLMAGETLWLSQALMAELFQTTPQNITIHTQTIYQDGELDPVATCKEFLQVRQEGRRQVQHQVKHYNLDAILAVGYRVRSPAGVRFRRWASDKLKEYISKMRARCRHGWRKSMPRENMKRFA
ncbi:MAG: virulence RhuM family protein [Magnetococcales bacterium]|nr:virulence RhuM family protein [Magnetococcales bacterium]